MNKMGVATFTASVVGVTLFMAHFWSPISIGAGVLWPIAGLCAIFSIYGGIIGRAYAKTEQLKAHITAAAVIGCLVLLGLSLSAIFIFVPYLISVPT